MAHRTWSGLLCLLCAGCMTTAGGGSGGNAGNENGDDNNGNDNANTVQGVSMEGIAFVPASITVEVGTTVRWTNNESGAIPHTVTSGNPGDEEAGTLFDSGTVNRGASFEFTFDQVGTFEYFCAFHPAQMADGVVEVVGP